MTASESSADGSSLAPTVSKVTIFPPMCTMPVFRRRPSLRPPSTPCSPGLRRSLTFGVLGDDNATYPSSKWVSENRDQYAGLRSNVQTPRENFVITSLDSRKHKPQTTQIFHIKRINKKPVCSVQWLDTGKEQAGETEQGSEYSVSYTPRTSRPPHLIVRSDNEKPTDGSIVPVNISGSKFDVRSEMMLPVCDSTVISSARNPHKYLLRKRKVPPPHKDEPIACGILYPPPDYTKASRPQSSNQISSPVNPPDRVSVSSLSGCAFSRRKYIPPPPNHILNGFDGGVPAKTTGRFGDNLMPFMRVKTII